MLKTLPLAIAIAASAATAPAAEFVSPAVPYGSVFAVVGPNPEVCFLGGYVYPVDRKTWRCYPMGSNTAANPRFWALPDASYLAGFATPLAIFGADHAWVQDDEGTYVPMSRAD
jgi:hypothetical protein